MAPRIKDRGKGKGKAASGSATPTNWSNWEWDPESRRYRRYRLDENGNYDFQYDDEPQSKTIPRSRPTADPKPSENPQYSVSQNYRTSTAEESGNFGPGFDQLSLEDSTSTIGLQQSSSTRTETKNPKAQFEKPDPHFKVHHQNEFKWGRVLKVLWSEPKGNARGTTATGSFVEDNGQFEKVRRFVILHPKKGHCLCLPIITYTGQGVNKPGVHAADHTIIYTSTNPQYLPGEYDKGLTSTPIRMIPDSSRHGLDGNSRLNYAKIYTVECNVKVWFIGKIHPDSEGHLLASYKRHNGDVQPRVGGGTGGVGGNGGSSGSGQQSSASNLSVATAHAYGGAGSTQSSYNYNPLATSTESSYGNTAATPIPTAYNQAASHYSQPYSTFNQATSGYLQPSPTWPQSTSTYPEPVSNYIQPSSNYTQPITATSGTSSYYPSSPQNQSSYVPVPKSMQAGPTGYGNPGAAQFSTTGSSPQASDYSASYAADDAYAQPYHGSGEYAQASEGFSPSENSPTTYTSTSGQSEHASQTHSSSKGESSRRRKEKKHHK
ncbi:hypothetical protein G7Y89_g9303 [Cudoniella acicularis]|uniref:DUF6590 domain-containing protein n=1 Tax=Cudoniella acicularis TaxID=354080 RepID=A0A8H4REX5_9HELO|nr:hypothetical protein G7Y89_g9303 [Cudoniella acicularis]